MNRLLRSGLLLGATLVLAPGSSWAQEVEALGTRALGMGGAFVGVADDASAVYWNPAGLAAGAYFSLVLDRTSSKSLPDNDLRGASSSGTLVAVTTPALGIGYYRLRNSTVVPLPTAGTDQGGGFGPDGLLRVDTLVTHQAGITVVQSLTGAIAVGGTIKIVRGSAGSMIAKAGDHEGMLDSAADIPGRTSTKLDADIGIMAALRGLRAGLVVRNLREPEFESAASGPSQRLRRQARAGVSVRPLGVLLAADVDLTRNSGPFGDTRDVAVGAEARIVSRAFVRAGARVNTLDQGPGGRDKVLSVGGSVAVAGSAFVDAQISTEPGAGSHRWGVAARVGF